MQLPLNVDLSDPALGSCEGLKNVPRKRGKSQLRYRDLNSIHLVGPHGAPHGDLELGDGPVIGSLAHSQLHLAIHKLGDEIPIPEPIPRFSDCCVASR